MKYLRSKHNIAVKSNQAQDLRNMGYYHGFKGYRFIRVPSQRISFTSLDEIIALNKFDMKLKALRSKGEVEGEKFDFILPETFMNNSGNAVCQIINDKKKSKL